MLGRYVNALTSAGDDTNEVQVPGLDTRAIAVTWAEPTPAGPETTDFYEFNWAHLPSGTTLGQVVAYSWGVLTHRRPLPERLAVPIARLGAIAFLVLAIFLVVATYSDAGAALWWAGLLIPAIALSFSAFLARWEIPPRLRRLQPWLRTRRARTVWLVLGALSLLLTWSTVAVRVGGGDGRERSLWVAAALVVLVFCLRTIWRWVDGLLRRTIGDVPRYLVEGPENVELKRGLANEGLALLHYLHRTHPDGKEPLYDNVVVIGHSLGSVVALDLVHRFWAESCQSRAFEAGSDEAQQLKNAGAAFLRSNGKQEATTGLRNAKDTVFSAISQTASVSRWKSRQFPWDLGPTDHLSVEDLGGGVAHARHLPWLVSNLVTVAFPLAYGDALVDRSAHGLRSLQKRRRLPHDPPLPLTSSLGIVARKGKQRFLHQSAVFSAVHWTNIWFANDLVGDSAGRYWGPGVSNEEIADFDGVSRPRCFPFIHTKYPQSTAFRTKVAGMVKAPRPGTSENETPSADADSDLSLLLALSQVAQLACEVADTNLGQRERISDAAQRLRNDDFCGQALEVLSTFRHEGRASKRELSQAIVAAFSGAEDVREEARGTLTPNVVQLDEGQIAVSRVEALRWLDQLGVETVSLNLEDQLLNRPG